jgi:uroporphyrinogen decarboxylase
MGNITGMTRRERILRAIEFRGPDRCPIHHWVFPGAIWRHGQRLLDLAARYPDDLRNEGVSANVWESLKPGEAVDDVIETSDAAGAVSRRLRGYTSAEVIVPAIPTWDAYRAFAFPAPPPDSHFADFEARVRRLHPDEFVSGSGGGFFQYMMALRGPENFMMDLAEDNEGANDLADRLVALTLHCIERYLAAGADCINFGDDWGSQDRLLIHPEVWRRFFKPRYARMFAPVRDAGRHVWFHTDGFILDILDDLLEIGVTVLNPQHTIMGTRHVAEIVAGRACIRTDIDRQWVLPNGTPDDVAAAVRQAIAAFGANNGGVLLHGEVGQDVPLANVEALWSSFYEYGQYPLSWLDT